MNKATRGRVDHLKEKVKYGKKRLRYLKTLEAGADSELWEALKSEFERCIRIHTNKQRAVLRDLDLPSNQRGEKASLHENALTIYQGAIDIVEKSDDVIRQVNNDIEAVNEQINNLVSGKTETKESVV